MQLKHTFMVLMTAIIALLIPMSVFATSSYGTVNSATFYCDAVQFNYDITSYQPVTLQVRDASNNVLGSQFHGTASGTFTTTIYLNTSVADGTELRLFVSDTYETIPFYGGSSGNCSGLLNPPDTKDAQSAPVPAPAPPAQPQYRLFGSGDATTSILLVDDNNGSGTTLLAFYAINEASQGSLLFYFSSNDPIHSDHDGETVLIYENETLAFYRLSTGEYQVNAGPDFEGKMHVLRFQWDGGEPYDVTMTPTSSLE